MATRPIASPSREIGVDILCMFGNTKSCESFSYTNGFRMVTRLNGTYRIDATKSKQKWNIQN